MRVFEMEKAGLRIRKLAASWIAAVLRGVLALTLFWAAVLFAGKLLPFDLFGPVKGLLELGGQLLCAGLLIWGIGKLLRLDFRLSLSPSSPWRWVFAFCVLDAAFVCSYALAHGAELRMSATWFQWNAVPALVLSAAMEELMLRALVLGCLERITGVWGAWVIQALLFALMHRSPSAAGWAEQWPHVLTGLIYGVLALQSGSIWPGLLYHVFVNSMQTLIGAELPLVVPVGPGAVYGALWSLGVMDFAWYAPLRGLMYAGMLATLLGVAVRRGGLPVLRPAGVAAPVGVQGVASQA